MMSPAPDDELDRRQSALQAEANDLLAELRPVLAAAGVDSLIPTGSFVSGLMSWREIDVMVLGGPEFSPLDVLGLLRHVVRLPGTVEFHYVDERGDRGPTGQTRDERFHLAITVERPTGPWRIDLSVWLYDDHANVTAWHENLRDTISPEQRRAVLRIKDVWHRRPDYPDDVGGLDIYTAVLDAGVRTPAQFGRWLHVRDRAPG